MGDVLPRQDPVIFFVRVMLCLGLLIPGVVLAQEAGDASADQEQQTYICPMACDDLEFDAPGDCPVCGMHLVAQEPEGFFDEEAIFDDSKTLEEAKRDTALMPGLGPWFFYIGWLGLLLATLLGWIIGSKFRLPDRANPLRGWVKTPGALTRFAAWRGTPLVLQIVVVALFIFVIVAGLIGNQAPDRNIAPVITWNIWWMGLIFFAFLFGEAWCTVCPWMAIPDWAQRAATKIRKTVPSRARWPSALRNLYPAVLMFFLVTWLELAYDAPYRPSLTAWMGVGMVALATITLIGFERKSFCRYVCAIGRVTGAYGMTGMAAIRRSDSEICKRCETKDCFHGNENGLPCPTFEYMGAMNDNMYCTMCTECLKTCPHDNIEVQVRAPFADIFGSHRHRFDESILILSIACVTVFHGLAMVPFWYESLLDPFRAWVTSSVGDPGFLAVYTILMAAFVAATLIAYTAFVLLSKMASGNQMYGVKTFFVAFAYATLPVSLCYHLAHNALHFFYEGSKLARLVSDPFGWDWNLFGTADWPLTMLIPIPLLWGAQIVLMWLGQTVAVASVGQIARRLIGNRNQVLRARIPMTLCVFLLSAVCLWLLNQPMEMRTG